MEKAETVRQLSSIPREHVLRVVEVIAKKMWHRKRKKRDTLKDKMSYVDWGNGLLVPIDGLLLAAHKLDKKRGTIRLFNSIRYLLYNYSIVKISPQQDSYGLAMISIPHKVIRDIKAYYPQTFRDE